MPLNDDPVLGRLVDNKQYPGDSQEDFNAELLMVHDENLLMKYIEKHVGMFTLENVLEELRECSDTFYERVLKKYIKVYSLNSLKMYLTDPRIDGFSEHVRMLLKCTKIKFLDEIQLGTIKQDTTREELTKILEEKDFKSVFLVWGILYLDQDSYSQFMNRIFSEYKEPIYEEGD